MKNDASSNLSRGAATLLLAHGVSRGLGAHRKPKPALAGDTSSRGRKPERRRQAALALAHSRTRDTLTNSKTASPLPSRGAATLPLAHGVSRGDRRSPKAKPALAGDTCTRNGTLYVLTETKRRTSAGAID